jgi:hypothetical protein
MNAASLMVRIGADVEDFTRGMTKAEKAAKKGFSEISEAALKMTEFFSIEFAAAALEFAHLAAEAQDASARMDRVFGGASAEMKEKLEQLTHSIPETVAQMQNLAVQSDNMLQGLGYGAEKAASMSVEMVKLAGDMAAFAHVPVADALEALDRGLAGKTRGLIQFGIVVNQQSIHLEAMRRGLIDQHRTLTELGTAEIAESLIRKASTRITGEAERTAGQASNSFKFLKVSVEELGVSVGNILLPPVKSLVDTLKSAAEAMQSSSAGAKKVVLWAGAIVAAIGPAILITVRFAKELIALRRAMELFAAGEGIAAVIGGIAAAPVATVIAALIAITAAAAGVYAIWRKFKGEKDDLYAPLNSDPSLAAAMAPKGPKKADGPLSADNRSPLDQFKAHASAIQTNFDLMVAAGQPLMGLFKAIQDLNEHAVSVYARQADKLSDMAIAAAEIDAKTSDTIAAMSVASPAIAGMLGIGGTAAQTLNRASTDRTPDTALRLSMARQEIGAETQLRQREMALRLTDTFNSVREASASMGEQIRTTAHDLDVRAVMLTLKDGFNATKLAAVELGERFRQSSHAFEVEVERFKQQWAGKGSIAQSAGVGLKDSLSQLLQAFTPAALAAQAFGAVMQGLQPVINALFVPLAEFGKIIGLVVIPILRPLFTALKSLGIATALVGEVLYSVAGGIARVIGGLISAIGGFIRKIPFMGGIGKDIQDFGDGITNLGKSFFKTADELDTARRQLQDLSFEQAMNGLTKAANAAGSAMLNVPAGFRAALAQLNALTPGAPSNVGGPVGSSSVVSSTGNLTVNLLLPNGDKLTTVVLKDFKRRAQAQFGDSNRWSEVMA